MTMRISAYIRPTNLIKPTGVGKHQIYMVRELARMPETELNILVHEKDLVDGKLPGKSDLFEDIPLIKLPGSGRITERLWTMFNKPLIINL